MWLTRRAMLAVPAVAFFPPPLFAQTRRVRRDITSPQGQADLAKFARAVRLMMDLPEGDPRSWMFHWYVHAVRGDRSKVGEVQRVFPALSPARSLALETWSTCKAHLPGLNGDDFLPWHRMYLMGFENAIRALLGDPGFMLPYWNYTNPAQRQLPVAFRRPGDSLYGALHRPERNVSVNGGDPLDNGFGGSSPLNTAALEQVTYRPDGAREGFCREIDRKLHGSVHVLIGNALGMGNVPWAANDPIFWLHHCNVDRLWASWNANGGLNPTDSWATRSFVLPDGLGGRADIRIESIANLASAGYEYDRLEPGPQITVGVSGATDKSTVYARNRAPIILSDTETRVPLVTLRRQRGVIPVAGARLYLRLSGLRARAPVGVLYRVQMQDSERRWTTVGHINFFDAVQATTEHEPHERTDDVFSFDVTDIAAGQGRTPPVRLLAVGQPEQTAVPIIGELEFVEN